MQRGETEIEKEYDDDNDYEDEDEMYQSLQDYNYNSQVDPEYLPSKHELKKADREDDM